MWPMSFMLADLTNRKKLDGTWMASPAASAFSRAATEVIPVLPSADGQSAGLVTSTGMTSHHIALVFASALAITWLWFGVGRKIFVAGGGSLPSATRTAPRSTVDACIVHVPGVSSGAGHCVYTIGCVL